MKVGQLGQNQADSGSWFPAVSHQVSPPPVLHYSRGFLCCSSSLCPLLSALDRRRRGEQSEEERRTRLPPLAVVSCL